MFRRLATSTTGTTITATVFAHSVLQTVGVGSKLKPEKEIQKDV
nr:MAG TPA: hypothetical protein [Bacteriophage sp.]